MINRDLLSLIIFNPFQTNCFLKKSWWYINWQNKIRRRKNCNLVSPKMEEPYKCVNSFLHTSITTHIP